MASCIYCGRTIELEPDRNHFICGNCKSADGSVFTLRDFFAGCALIGYTSRYPKGWKGVDIRKASFLIADAMLEAREA